MQSRKLGERERKTIAFAPSVISCLFQFKGRSHLLARGCAVKVEIVVECQ